MTDHEHDPSCARPAFAEEPREGRRKSGKRRARHRRPRRLASSWALLRASLGELGPGVQNHVVSRYIADNLHDRKADQ